jgi:hypothetical protein
VTRSKNLGDLPAKSAGVTHVQRNVHGLELGAERVNQLIEQRSLIRTAMDVPYELRKPRHHAGRNWHRDDDLCHGRKPREAFGGEVSSAAARFHTKFAEDIFHMLVHGARGGSDRPGDFGIALSQHEPVQHFTFAGRQAERARPSRIGLLSGPRWFWSGGAERAFEVELELVSQKLLAGSETVIV